MSARLDQNVSELLYLKGARILGVSTYKPKDAYEFECIQLEVELNSRIEVVDEDGNVLKRAMVQVWEDGEGNGPGFLQVVA